MFTNIKNSKNKPIIAFVFSLVVVSSAITVFALFARPSGAQDTGLSDEDTQAILDLNSQIEQKRKAVEELEKKAQVYEQTAQRKAQESVNIEGRLESLDQSIEQTATEIKKTETQIEQYTLEIQQVEGSIEKRTAEIGDSKDKIGEFIRVIQRTNTKTYLEISLENDTFSSFFMHQKAIKDIEGEMKKSLDRLQVLKTDLENQRQDLTAKKTDLDTAHTQLKANQDAAEQEKQFKEVLLDKTKQETFQYQSLLDEAQTQHDQAVGEANVLENRFRDKLKESNVNVEDLLGQATDFIWPISPTRGISAYFHDPSYPWGVHTAIDIPAGQGTPVRAAADGVIAAAKQPYMISPGNPGYSWISIIHAENVSTQYWHMSQVNVEVDQFVRKGEVIGLSGGQPGVAGSGWQTTGPHLHFEVRVNGIPVNPLDYLK